MLYRTGGRVDRLTNVGLSLCINNIEGLRKVEGFGKRERKGGKEGSEDCGGRSDDDEGDDVIALSCASD